MADPVEGIFSEEPPIVFVFSDARGKTAVGVVEAAASQFVDGIVTIKQLGNVHDVETVAKFIDENVKEDSEVAVFHTIGDNTLRRDLRLLLDGRRIPSIDLLGPAITIISTLTGEEPRYETGRRTQVTIEDATV